MFSKSQNPFLQECTLNQCQVVVILYMSFIVHLTDQYICNHQYFNQISQIYRFTRFDKTYTGKSKGYSDILCKKIGNQN